VAEQGFDLIERVWRAVNRADVDALVELVTDDIDFRPPAHLLDGITFSGPAGVRTWAIRSGETWREVHGAPRELATAGERVAVAIDLRLTGHGSGVPISQEAFFVYTLRDGKVAAAIAYPGEREALAALGA
jgi:ketosteroid isomerase-like protein